jgi:hypothetical protein
MDGWAEQFICNGETKVGCGSCRRPDRHCRRKLIVPPLQMITTTDAECCSILQDYVIPNNRCHPVSLDQLKPGYLSAFHASVSDVSPSYIL